MLHHTALFHGLESVLSVISKYDYKYKDHDQEEDAIGRNDMYDKISLQVGE